MQSVAVKLVFYVLNEVRHLMLHPPMDMHTWNIYNNEAPETLEEHVHLYGPSNNITIYLNL